MNRLSHITCLVAICEGRVHVIFFWSFKGTHIGSLENDGIHIHLVFGSHFGRHLETNLYFNCLSRDFSNNLNRFSSSAVSHACFQTCTIFVAIRSTKWP